MKKSIACIVAAILVSACSSVRIKDVDRAPAFTLSQYKTFSFYDIEASGDALGPKAQENAKLLMQAVSKQLNSRGLLYQEKGGELLVNIGVTVMEEVQTRETSFANPGDRMAYVGQRNYHWESSEVAVGTYRNGSAALELVEAKSNSLKWRGVAESVLPDKEKNLPGLIDEAMAKLIARID
ncbi:MAG: DUF4136 domain-containing protein [Cyclobacteriaceae bacterium]|jgi:hypothetical protein